MPDYSDVVLLLARQRSGTNALRSVLELHPQVFCFPEIFEAGPGQRRLRDQPATSADANYFVFLHRLLEGDVRAALALEDHEEAFLRYLDYLRCFSDKRYLVVDVKYNSTHHVRRLWRFISECPYLFEVVRKHGVRVLHLTRRNYLRYYLSEAKAQQWKRWHTFDEAIVGGEQWFTDSNKPTKVDDEALEVDPEHLLHMLRLCAAETEAVEQAFAGYEPYLELDYDDLFDSIGAPVSPTALRSIAEWLNVEPDFPEPRPMYKKQSALPLKRSIRNYQSIARILRGSPFEDFLQDERMYRRASSPTRRRQAAPA